MEVALMARLEVRDLHGDLRCGILFFYILTSPGLNF